MGLPSNGEDVEKFLATDEEMKQRFNLPESKINIYDLTRDLEFLPPNEEFKVKFLLYVVSTVIRPSSSYNHVNSNLLGLFKDPQLCRSLNWAKYTLEGLVQGIRKYQEKNHDVLSAIHISGCTLLLEIFYLENFAVGQSKIPNQFRNCPRIMDWDNDMVNTTVCQLLKLRRISDLDGSKNKIVDQEVVVSSSQRVPVPGAVPHSSSSGIIVVQADKKRRASKRFNLRSTGEIKKGKAVSSPFVGQQCKGKRQPKVETVAAQESSDSVHTVDIEKLLKDAVMEISRYVFEGSDYEKTIICDFGNHYATKGDFTSMRLRETISSVILDVVANALTLDEIAKTDGHKNWYLPTYFAQMALGTSENWVVDDYINHLKKGEDPYMGNLSTVEKDVLGYIEPNRREMIKWLVMHPANKLHSTVIDDTLSYNRRIDTKATLQELRRIRGTLGC